MDWECVKSNTEREINIRVAVDIILCNIDNNTTIIV